MAGPGAEIERHIQGNLNVGTNQAVLTELITQLLAWIGHTRTFNALKCLKEVAASPTIVTKLL